jgi:hypothetical protein
MSAQETPPVDPNDDKNRFDIYHFINRWDFMLAIGVILLFLLWLLGHYLHPSTPGV